MKDVTEIRERHEAYAGKFSNTTAVNIEYWVRIQDDRRILLAAVDERDEEIARLKAGLRELVAWSDPHASHVTLYDAHPHVVAARLIGETP